MRLQLEDLIAELRLRLQEEKGIRNKVLLEIALNNLIEYKKANEKII